MPKKAGGATCAAPSAEQDRAAIEAQLAALKAASAAVETTAGEASKAIRDGFSTYKLMLRRRRRRLVREANLHVELKGEELLEGTETLEGQIERAKSGAEDGAAAGGGAGGSGGAAAGGADDDGEQLTEDEIFELVEDMDLDEARASCEEEGIDAEGMDLDDMKAELIELMTEQAASAGGGGGSGGGGGAAEVDPDIAEYIEAIKEMDEEEAVEACEEEGIDWEEMEGLTELRQALIQHFTGGGDAGGAAAGGAADGESAEDDNFYAGLIAEMDLATALSAAEDEGVELADDVTLAQAKSALLAHFCPGRAGSGGSGGMQWLLDLEVKPAEIYPLTFSGDEELKGALTTMGNMASTRVSSVAAMIAASVEGVAMAPERHDFDSESSSDSGADEPAPEPEPAPAARAGTVAVVAQLLRILPDVELVDADGEAAITVEQARQVMILLKPYKTGGPAAPPQFVPSACAGLRTIADIGDDYRRVIGQNDGVVMLADWLEHTAIDSTTIAVCEVLASLCTLHANVRSFIAAHGLAHLFRVLDNVSRRSCFPAAVEVLAKIVAHQPEDGEIATIVISGAGEYRGLDALFSSLKSEPTPDFLVKVCRVLFFLTEDELTRQQVVDPSSGYMRILGDLLHEYIREHEVSAVEHICSVWVQLGQGHEAAAVAKFLAEQSVLADLKKAFEEFPKEVTVQQCLIALIASMGISSEIKMAVAFSKLLDCIVKAMMRFRGKADPRFAEIQEQGCRAINAISKGEEKIKEYLADRQDELHVMEAITEALQNFKRDEGLALHGCSAVWSVAFKNVRMKNRAGEVGVFPTIIELIMAHKRNQKLLPHALVAIGNLSANHAPNQALCGQEGVVDMCLEIMPLHRKEPTIMYTLLSCLNSVMAEQPDNIAIFNEGNGKAMVEKVQRMHDDAKVQQLSTNVLGCVEHDAQQAKERAKQRRRGGGKKGSVMGKGNALEERELLREPMAGLSLQAKGTTLKQAKCSVRYKKGKTQEAKEVFLHQHELKFFKAGATDFKRADETIPIALITSVKPERSISTPCIVIETRLPAFKKLWMYPPSQAEAAQWIQQLGKLKPTMEAKLKLTDDKGKEKLERHVAWQGNALFTFGAKHFKMKRCYAAKKMSQIELGPKNSFIIHETKVASSFRYLCDSADQAAKWHSFLEDQTLEEQLRKAEADDAVARKAAEKAQAEREKAEKLEQEEQDRAAKQALKEARLQMAAEEDELLDAEEAAEEQARLEQAQLAEQERDASNEKKKRARATNRKDMKKLTEEIDMARMDIEECDEAVGAQLEENAELEATLEQEEKLLAETNANLKEMTDELEELLRGKGVELSSVMPELREMNEAKVTSDTRSAWRQREVEQQQARDDIVSNMIGGALGSRRELLTQDDGDADDGDFVDDGEWSDDD